MPTASWYLIANSGKPDPLCPKEYLDICICSSFTRCLNEGRKWHHKNDYYKYVRSILPEHLVCLGHIDDPMIKKIVLYKRRYDWPGDLVIVCIEDTAIAEGNV